MRLAKKHIFLSIAFCGLLSFAPLAYGATYNIGAGQTYTTFTALVAAQNLAAGDIVDGGGGTFREIWVPDGSGSSGNQITIRNATVMGSEPFATWTAEATTNLLTYSEAFQSWNPTALTSVSTDASTVTDPHGGNTADGVITTAADAQHGVFNSIVATPATAYSMSVFARPGAKAWVWLVAIYYDAEVSPLGSSSCYFEIPIGTVGTADGTSSTWNLEGKNNFRNIGFAATTPATTAYIMYHIMTADGDGDSTTQGDATNVDMYLWGAQITQSATPSHYGTAYYVASVSTEAKTAYQSGTHLKRCTAKNQLIYGSFWWDDANDRVYAKTTTLADPDTFTMELGQRDYGLFAYNLDYLTITNMTFQYTNSFPLLLMNDAGVHTGMIVDGVTTIGGDGGIASVGADDLVIRNSNISKSGSISSTSVAGITIQAGNATVEDTDIHDGFSNGFIALVSGTSTLRRVTVSRMGDGTYLGRAGVGGIGTSTINAYNVVVSQVEEDGFSVNDTATLNCYGCSADGCGNSLISSANYSGDGYTAHSGTTLNLYNSIGNNNYKSGVGVTATSTGVIYNCTFYNNYETSTDRGATPWLKNQGIGIDSTGNWVIKNNITSNNGTEINITATAVAGGTQTADYNLYYDSRGGSGFHYNGTDYNFANWKTASSLDAHSLNADPLLTATYTLGAGSPARNAGAPLWTYAAFPGDFYGNKIYGSAPDMGAIEKKQFIWEDNGDAIPKKCKSSNTACYNAP